MNDPAEYMQFNPANHVPGHLNPAYISTRDRKFPEQAIWEI